MPSYSTRDLLLLPNLISLVRLPLALAFPLLVEEPFAALSVLASAGVSDVLDGWYARRRGQVTPTGAIVDPVSDKLFVCSVVATLAGTDRLPLIGVVLLATREIGELPLLFLWLTDHRRRNRKASNSLANAPGKFVTVLQFLAVTSALIARQLLVFALVACAIAGVFAAALYWKRELEMQPG